MTLHSLATAARGLQRTALGAWSMQMQRERRHVIGRVGGRAIAGESKLARSTQQLGTLTLVRRPVRVHHGTRRRETALIAL